MHIELGVFTDFGANIVSRYRVEEMFIDFTFKTNLNKLELLCVMLFCFDPGVPLAYFVLELGKS